MVESERTRQTDAQKQFDAQDRAEIREAVKWVNESRQKVEGMSLLFKALIWCMGGIVGFGLMTGQLWEIIKGWFK